MALCPGFTDALILLADLFLEYESGHCSQTEPWYRRTVNKHWESQEAPVKLGICLEGTNKGEETRKCFEKVLDLTGIGDYTAIARKHAEGLKCYMSSASSNPCAPRGYVFLIEVTVESITESD